MTSSDTDPGISHIMSPEEFLWKFINDNKDRIQKTLCCADLEENANRLDVEMSRLQAENSELRKRLAIAEGRLTRAEKKLDDVQDKTTDLVTRSMRDNLIFKNIAESTPESSMLIEQKIRSFLADEMRVDDNTMDNIIFERAHRIGKASNNRIRHIIVKFNSKGKSEIMRHLRYLSRDCPVKTAEQFLQEVHAGLYKLWPIYVEAKKDGKEPKWNIDELQIGLRRMKPPKDHDMDINLDTTDVALSWSQSRQQS